MELQDYATALRRYWKTWVGLALLGVLAAVAVVLLSTPSYQATSTVFVASTGESTSGSQFVNQRVTSYPDIAMSRTVLAPVLAQTGLREPLTALRGQVDATNPPGTSLIKISATDEDPVWAAQVANAVADQFRQVVEDLETPNNGRSPVRLTVTDRATVPSTPVFPVPGLLLPLGLVIGLFLGLATAILRSRRDTRLYREEDVRAAWGNGADELPVYATPAGARRRGASSGPATMLTRRLEPVAAHREVRLVAVAVSPDAEPDAWALVQDVEGQLTECNLPLTVAPGPDGDVPRSGRPGVHVVFTTARTSLPEWRRVTADDAGAVLVVRTGRTDRAHLREIRSILDALGAPVFAVVLMPRRRRRQKDAGRAPRSRAVPAQGSAAPVAAAASGPRTVGAGQARS